MFCYLVDWGNGYVGGFDKEFCQSFNTPKSELITDLKTHNITSIQVITPEELDRLRGGHMPTLDEYLKNCTTALT